MLKKVFDLPFFREITAATSYNPLPNLVERINTLDLGSFYLNSKFSFLAIFFKEVAPGLDERIQKDFLSLCAGESFFFPENFSLYSEVYAFLESVSLKNHRPDLLEKLKEDIFTHQKIEISYEDKEGNIKIVIPAWWCYGFFSLPPLKGFVKNQINRNGRTIEVNIPLKTFCFPLIQEKWEERDYKNICYKVLSFFILRKKFPSISTIKELYVYATMADYLQDEESLRFIESRMALDYVYPLWDADLSTLFYACLTAVKTGAYIPLEQIFNNKILASNLSSPEEELFLYTLLLELCSDSKKFFFDLTKVTENFFDKEYIKNPIRKILKEKDVLFHAKVEMDSLGVFRPTSTMFIEERSFLKDFYLLNIEGKDFQKFPLETVLSFIKEYQILEVSCSDFSFYGQEIEEICSHSQHLKKVTLKNCAWFNSSQTPEVILKNTSIEELILDGVALHEGRLPALMKIFSLTLKRVYWKGLEWNNRLSTREEVSYLPKLKSIEFEGIFLEKDFFPELLTHAPELKKIYLNKPVKKITLFDQSFSLEQTFQIEELFFKNVKINDTELSSFLKKCPGIKKVSLERC